MCVSYQTGIWTYLLVFFCECQDLSSRYREVSCVSAVVRRQEAKATTKKRTRRRMIRRHSFRMMRESVRNVSTTREIVVVVQNAHRQCIRKPFWRMMRVARKCLAIDEVVSISRDDPESSVSNACEIVEYLLGRCCGRIERCVGRREFREERRARGRASLWM